MPLLLPSAKGVPTLPAVGQTQSATSSEATAAGLSASGGAGSVGLAAATATGGTEASPRCARAQASSEYGCLPALGSCFKAGEVAETAGTVLLASGAVVPIG